MLWLLVLFAASLMKVEIMRHILDSGRIDLEASTMDEDGNNMTALHIIVLNADRFKGEAVDAVELLLDKKANIEAKGCAGYTPLLVAASFLEHSEVVETLLKRGADTCAKLDENEQTPLHLVMEKCNLEVIKAFVSHGKNLYNMNVFLRQPIHEAAYHGCVNGLEQLALIGKVGIDIKTPSKPDNIEIGTEFTKIYYGTTPLHFAALMNKYDFVESLIELGAKPTIYNDHNKSALDYATNSGFEDSISGSIDAE